MNGHTYELFKTYLVMFKLSEKGDKYDFCGSFVLFMSGVCHALASIHCCLVIT